MRILSEPMVPNPKFWPRQFGAVETSAQDKFDVVFGLILPGLCFMADPLIFKNGIAGPPELQNYQLVVYAISTVQMGLFVVWRTFRKRVSWVAPLFAGAFFAGALLSFVIGVTILPVTLIGLLFGIGVLGFTPFVTSFVYLRQGIRALRVPLKDSRRTAKLSAATLGAVLAIAVPQVASVKYDRVVSASVHDVILGDAATAEAAATRLHRLHFVPAKYFQVMESAYVSETDPAKQKILRRTYKDITGEYIKERRSLIVE